MTLKILLVDDSHVFAAAARRVLDRLPGACVVGHALDGINALERIRLLRPDLVLLDINLPDMSGFEVARLLRAAPQSPHLVFVSVSDDCSYRDAAHALGAEGFASKGNFTNELVPLIERMVRVGLRPTPD